MNAFASLIRAILEGAVKSGRGFAQGVKTASLNSGDALRMTATQGYFTTAKAGVSVLMKQFSSWLNRGSIANRLAKALGVQVAADQIITGLLMLAADVISQTDQLDSEEIESLLDRAILPDGSIDVKLLLEETLKSVKNLTILEMVLYFLVLIAVLFKDNGRIATKVFKNRAVGANSIGMIKIGSRVIGRLAWKKGQLVLENSKGAVLFTVKQFKSNPAYFAALALTLLPTAYWALVAGEGDKAESDTTTGLSGGDSEDVNPSGAQGFSKSDRGTGVSSAVAALMPEKRAVITGTPKEPKRSNKLAAIRNKSDNDGFVEARDD
jgi:hypothetical protein